MEDTDHFGRHRHRLHPGTVSSLCSFQYTGLQMSIWTQSIRLDFSNYRVTSHSILDPHRSSFLSPVYTSCKRRTNPRPNGLGHFSALNPSFLPTKTANLMAPADKASMMQVMMILTRVGMGRRRPGSSDSISISNFGNFWLYYFSLHLRYFVNFNEGLGSCCNVAKSGHAKLPPYPSVYALNWNIYSKTTGGKSRSIYFGIRSHFGQNEAFR